MLQKLTPRVELTALVQAELIEPLPTTSQAGFAFCHPLIQKVAYDSQLRSDRSKLHRLLAREIDQVDENASLIATHWEAAGDFHQAFAWHMRAGAWFNYRVPAAARMSWQRALAVADRLPSDDPERPAKQIAPRTLLCATTFRVGGSAADTGFDELKRLTTLAGDKRSLVIGMAGYLTTLAFRSHHREASVLASEFVSLVESLADRPMAVGLLPAAAQAKYEAGEVSQCLEIADKVIDLADGDATMGNIMVATPLAWAYTLRGTAKMCLGRRAWLVDLDRGLEVARPFDVGSRCNAALYKYVLAFQNETVAPDPTSLAETAEWLAAAEESGDDTAMSLARLIRGVTLSHASAQTREEGVGLLIAARDHLSWLSSALRRFADIEIARFRADQGDIDGAVALAQATLDEQFATGEMISRGAATTVLVEALLRRRTKADMEAARAAVNRLEGVPTEPGFVLHELPLRRLRALLAGADGAEKESREGFRRYAQRAAECGFAAPRGAPAGEERV
jgi:adenylate cyclase